jgi:hypothetical protein
MTHNAIQPYEVSYVTAGRRAKKERNVIGVICPTVPAQILGETKPIFVSLGDVRVDWTAPPSAGLQWMLENAA